MKEYILLDDDNNVVKHICADDDFTSEKYKVVEELNWEQDEQDIKSETEPVAIKVIEEQESAISSTDTDIVEETKQAKQAKQAKDKTLFTSFTSFTRTDELMIQLQEIDVLSVRAIRAILSGTDTEEDHKILKALEKQAINLRQELNAATADAVTTDTTNVDTTVDTTVDTKAVTKAVTNK